MTFSDDLKRFNVTLERRERFIFTNVVDECFRSIVEGSEITGAPGQPVGQYGPGYNNHGLGGNLKASWQKWYDSKTVANIATNVRYAPYIEQGGNSRGAFQLRSAVGGWHSVGLTVSNFDRIVAAVTQQVAPND